MKPALWMATLGLLSAAPAYAQGAVKVDSKHYKVELERPGARASHPVRARREVGHALTPRERRRVPDCRTCGGVQSDFTLTTAGACCLWTSLSGLRHPHSPSTCMANPNQRRARQGDPAHG
jgi:hypothetical protein